MINKTLYENTIQDTINSIKDDFNTLSVEEAINGITDTINGDIELINFNVKSEGTNGFDEGMLLSSHAQLEAVKEVLQDETISEEINKANPEFISETMDKIEPVIESCKEIEDKNELFKVEEKPQIEANTTYQKFDLDRDNYDAKLNFNSLCDVFNIPKNSEGINRFGTSNAYETKGKVDRNVEIKMIPSSDKGVVSQFAVGKIDLGKNRELLFMGNIATDDNGKILPKLENINFIGTDNFDKRIPKYLQNEDGRCSEIDLNKGQLNELIPHGKYVNGKIDVKCSFDSVVEPFINNTGLHTIYPIKDGMRTLLPNADVTKLVQDSTCLHYNIETAVSELTKDFSDTIESGNINMEQVLEKSDTVNKLSVDCDTIKGISDSYKECLQKVEGLQEVGMRVLNHANNPQVITTEMSLYIPEMFELRQTLSTTTDKYDKYVDNIKTVNEAGVSKESYIKEQVNGFIDRYNDALEKKDGVHQENKEALKLHIGENGFVYNGVGQDASENFTESEHLVADDNIYSDAVASGQANKGLYFEQCDKDEILPDKRLISQDDIKGLSKCAIDIPKVQSTHYKYLESKGVSKENIETEMKAVFDKYFSNENDNIVESIKGYVKEVDNIINEREEFNDVEVLPAPKEKVTNEFKESMKDLYKKATDKMNIESAKMGKLGYGDPIIIGCSMVRAFAGLLSGEVKYVDDRDKDKPEKHFYSVADVTMSLYSIFTTSPSALVQSVLYRVLLSVCEKTIDVMIRDKVDSLSENVITDDLKQQFLETKEVDGKYVVDNGEQPVVNENVENNRTTEEAVINESSIDDGVDENGIVDEGEATTTPEEATEEVEEVIEEVSDGVGNEVETIEEIEEASEEFTEDTTSEPEDNATVEEDDNITNEELENVYDEDDEVEIISEDPVTEEIIEEVEEQIVAEEVETEIVDDEVNTEDISGDNTQDNELENSKSVDNQTPDTTTQKITNEPITNVVNDQQALNQTQLQNNGVDITNDTTELTQEMKEQLIQDIDDVLNGKISTEESSFGECFNADGKETCNVIEDALAEKITGAAGTIDEEQMIKDVADIVANITNVNNYDNSESLEAMISNINKKTNNKEIEEKLMSVIEGIIGDMPTSKADTEVLIENSEEQAVFKNEEERPTEVSIDLENKEFKVTELENGSSLITVNGQVVDNTLAEEKINNVATEVISKTDDVVDACTMPNPIFDKIDAIFEGIGINRDDIIDCLKACETQLPQIIQFAVDPQHAIQNIVSDYIGNFVNDKIKECTGVDIKEAVNDVKTDIVDALKDGISDLFNTQGIEIPTNFDNSNSQGVDNSNSTNGVDNDMEANKENVVGTEHITPNSEVDLLDKSVGTESVAPVGFDEEELSEEFMKDVISKGGL